MKLQLATLALALAALPAAAAPLAAASTSAIATPAEFLGHPLAADRQLARWPQVLTYLRQVDAASDRVSEEMAGKSTLGEEMPAFILTSAANQARLEEIREVNRKLAAGTATAEELPGLLERGRATALVTCSIHATEVGCTQMAMGLVHEVATTQDPDRLAWLDQVVVILMPSINPDGQVLVIDWYEKNKGTPYEGGPLPWLYHHYVGHDNNRDFAMLTQKETQAVNDLLYARWLPQAFLDEHQMGMDGPRMFVPPQADPLAAEVHSLVFRQADLLGTNMARRLEESDKLGVGHDMIFDSYWPGGTRNTAWFKNVTGLLTEVASVRIATPVWVDPVELRGGEKGLPEYQRRSNFPSPWPGGWWRLADIVAYERVATWAFVETLAQNRRDFLKNAHRMASEAIAAGSAGPPYAWIVPPDQRDPTAAAKLVDLLLRHQVRVERAGGPLTVGYTTYPAGTVVIPAAQPYRAFLLTMLRAQRYPEVQGSSGGPIFQPYDVTSWSLPLGMGVEVVEAETPAHGATERLQAAVWPGGEALAASAGGWRVSHSADGIYPLMNRLLADGVTLSWLAEPATPGGGRGDLWIAPDAIAPARLAELAKEARVPVEALPAAPTGARLPVKAARVGLYKPWSASMDEGWTRFLLERYGFPWENLDNAAIRSGSFAGKVDVVILPAVSPSVLTGGRPESPEARRLASPLPPEYQGGLDEEPGRGSSGSDAKADGKGGADAKPAGGGGSGQLRRWVEAGGTLVALDSSALWALDKLGLPVTDALGKTSEVEAPGSLLRVLVDTSHPLAFGASAEEAIYFAGSPAFQTIVPDGRFERRVVARYPDDEKDILVSGFLAGGEGLERRAALVEVKMGKGRVLLYGFRPQHRAQPVRTFKLLFNALYRVGEPTP